MKKTIKYTITTLILTLCMLTGSVFAEKAEKSETTKVDATSSAQPQISKDTKKDIKVDGDSKQSDTQELETQKYPIYINYNNSTSLDLLTEKQLDKLYKYFADNVKTTYPTMDKKDVLIFDQNNIYKMTKDLKNELKKMNDGKEVIPNGITLLNTKTVETDYTTTIYCLIILVAFAYFKFAVTTHLEAKTKKELESHKEK